MARIRIGVAALSAALAVSACGGTQTTELGDVSATSGSDAAAADGVGQAADGGADGDATRADDDAMADDGAGEGAMDDGEATASASAESLAAVAWAGTDLDGAAFDGAALAGQDVVLWVWAPWCSVCNREAPEVAEVMHARAGDVRFVGIAGKDSLEEHRGFVDKHDLGFVEHVADPDGSIWGHYGVGYQPAFVFINDDGSWTRHAGPMDTADLQAAIDALVAA